MTKNNKRFVIDEFFDNDDVLNSHIYMVDEIDGEIYSNSWICFKKVCELCNQLNDENEKLKQDKMRLIGFLHRYKDVHVEEVDELILNKENLDEWGELYYDKEDGVLDD